MTKQNPDKIFVVLIAAFLVCAAVSWHLYFKVYRQQDTVSIHHFPKTIEGWTSEELPITAEEKAILETDNVFARRYTHGKKEEVYLFIVYSQNNRKVSHPPEVCYTGSGAAILSSIHDFIETGDHARINVNRLMVEKGDVNQTFVYWFKVGDSFTPNYWHQQALIAVKSFFGKPASSALIRISSDIENDNTEEAVERIKKFGRLITPYLYQYLP